MTGPERTAVAPGLAPRTRPSTRFRVLERDGFRCRYCGRSAELGAVLEVDHLYPRSKGGSDAMDNLVTACWDCNRGKSARVLLGQPEPRKWRRPRQRRYPATPPAIVKEWPVGSHCATPLKVAICGYQLGMSDYRRAWLYFDRIIRHTGSQLPPHRMSDAVWMTLVKQYAIGVELAA